MIFKSYLEDNMKESEKGMKGDHRNLSDPSADKKDFIKHVVENAVKNGDKKVDIKSEDYYLKKEKEKSGNKKH